MPSKKANAVYEVVLGLCLKIKPRTPSYQPEAPVKAEYVPASQSAHADAPVPVPVQEASNLNGTRARTLAISGVKCAAVAIASLQLEKSGSKTHAGEACENANGKLLVQPLCLKYNTAT